jgi:hypothetical protein
MDKLFLVLCFFVFFLLIFNLVVFFNVVLYILFTLSNPVDKATISLLQTVIDKCKDDVTCSICYNLLSKTKILDCSHMFCSECIENWFVKSKV